MTKQEIIEELVDSGFYKEIDLVDLSKKQLLYELEKLNLFYEKLADAADEASQFQNSPQVYDITIPFTTEMLENLEQGLYGQEPTELPIIIHLTNDGLQVNVTLKTQKKDSV